MTKRRRRNGVNSMLDPLTSSWNIQHSLIYCGVAHEFCKWTVQYDCGVQLHSHSNFTSEISSLAVIGLSSSLDSFVLFCVLLHLEVRAQGSMMQANVHHSPSCQLWGSPGCWLCGGLFCSVLLTTSSAMVHVTSCMNVMNSSIMRHWFQWMVMLIVMNWCTRM